MDGLKLIHAVLSRQQAVLMQKKSMQLEISASLQSCPLRDLATVPIAQTCADFMQHGISAISVILQTHIPDLPPALNDERQHARRYPEGETGQRGQGFMLRRRIARALLSRISGCDAAQFRLEADRHGAPRVLYDGQPSPFYVSFSARQDLGLVAISRWPIGIDVEFPVHPDAIPFNLLRSDERAALDQLEPRARMIAFLRLWSGKEAVAKALGRGFSIAPEDIHLGFDDDNRLYCSDFPDDGISGHTIRMFQLKIEYFQKYKMHPLDEHKLYPISTCAILLPPKPTVS